MTFLDDSNTHEHPPRRDLPDTVLILLCMFAAVGGVVVGGGLYVLLQGSLR